MKTYEHAAAVVQRQPDASAAARQSRTTPPGPLQAWIDQSPRVLAQRRTIDAIFGPAKQAGETVQTQAAPANRTGLPDALKTGMEALSGMDMSGVRVHRNSSKPAQLNALAYAQGQDIHLGPGQEQHLPHEAWHVVQQAQGRVQPTMQVAGVGVNDDGGLEREADALGAKAASMANAQGARPSPDLISGSTGQASPAVQLMLEAEIEQMKTVVDKIRVDYPDYTVVSMGGSAPVIVAYMKSQDFAAYSIPLSIKDPPSVEQLSDESSSLNELRKMMQALGLEGIDKLLVIDVAGSGGSLDNGVQAIRAAWPEKVVKGLGFVESEDKKTEKTDKFKNRDPAVNPTLDSNLAPKLDFMIANADEEDEVDPKTKKPRGGFGTKLIGGAYKQYRDVGVFKPFAGDGWAEYSEDEAKLREPEDKIDEPGVQSYHFGSRKRYKELERFLKLKAKDRKESKPVHDENYEEDSNKAFPPPMEHKALESKNADERIKRIEDARLGKQAPVEQAPVEQAPVEQGGVDQQGAKGCCVVQ